MKFFVELSAPGGSVFLTQDEVIGKMAMWYHPDYRLTVKALVSEALPLALMPIARQPWFFETQIQAEEAVKRTGKELAAIRQWAVSGQSDLFQYLDACSFGTMEPVEIPASIKGIDLPDGYDCGSSNPAWHVATHYKDQGYLFLEDSHAAQTSWVKNPDEGAVWFANTEEEALAKAKLITRTESLYAYPKFCGFS